VTDADLTLSRPKTFAVPVDQGFAVGFSFNVTNRAECDVNAEKLRVILRSVLYQNATQVTQNLDEVEGKSGAIKPGDSATFSFTFSSYFDRRPTMLNLRIEMTFGETGSVLVFDGELPVP